MKRLIAIILLISISMAPFDACMAIAGKITDFLGELQFSYPEWWEFVKNDEDNYRINIIANEENTGIICLYKADVPSKISTNNDLLSYIPMFCKSIGRNGRDSWVRDTEKLAGKRALDFTTAALDIDSDMFYAYATIINGYVYTVTCTYKAKYIGVNETNIKSFFASLSFTKPELSEEEMLPLLAERRLETARIREEEKARLSEEHNSLLRNLLIVSKVSTSKPNSAGGVTLNVSWSNASQKEIKYITFTVVALNAVGDEVACEITGDCVIDLELTGPFKNGKKNKSSLKNAWYNKTIKKAQIDEILIEYMDETMITISGEYIDYQWIK